MATQPTKAAPLAASPETKSLTVAQKEAEAFKDKSPEFVAAVKWQQQRFGKSLDDAVKTVSAEKEWPVPAKPGQEVIDPNIEKEAKLLDGKSKDWTTLYQWQRTRYGKSIDDAARIASEQDELAKKETAKA